MLGIFPRWHPVNVNLPRDFLKAGYFTRGVKSGVQTRLGHPPILQRPIPRLVERHHISATQAKVCPQRRAFVVTLPFDHHPHDPPSRTGWVNDKIKPAAIAMPPSAQILHQLLGQLTSQGHR
jgi:hypothetical protein